MQAYEQEVDEKQKVAESTQAALFIAILDDGRHMVVLFAPSCRSYAINRKSKHGRHEHRKESKESKESSQSEENKYHDGKLCH